MNRSTVQGLIEKSIAKQISFPDILKTLAHEGVESYHARRTR
jgi:hypothetical protein